MPLENGSFDRNAVILLDTYVCIMHINTRDGWGGEWTICIHKMAMVKPKNERTRALTTKQKPKPTHHLEH